MLTDVQQIVILGIRPLTLEGIRLIKETIQSRIRLDRFHRGKRPRHHERFDPTCWGLETFDLG